MKTFHDLKRFLQGRNVHAELLEFEETVHTVDDAVKALGVPKESIIKSLILTCGTEGLCAIIPGDGQLDFKRIVNILGKGTSEVRLAKSREVLKLTDYEVGGVPPIDLPIKVLIDKKVLGRDFVIGGGGDSRHLLKIPPSEIVGITNAIICEISS